VSGQKVRVVLGTGVFDKRTKTVPIQSFVHLGDNVEAVLAVEGLRASVANHPQIRLPHIRADERDLRGRLGSDQGEEPLKGLDGALPANPEQPRTVLLELVDQGSDTCVPSNTESRPRRWPESSRPEGAMLPAPTHHVLHGMTDLLPGGTEGFGGLLPVEFARPACKTLRVDLGEPMFAAGPRHFFHRHAQVLQDTRLIE
jgi:hypothetical protein